MQYAALALCAVSFLFFVASGVMLALARKRLAQARKRPKAEPPPLDVTAQDLLHDLTKRGSAIVKIDVIDPSNLLLRSPRR